MIRREDPRGPARPIQAVPAPTAEDPTWERLEDQISWYDRKSGENQRRYPTAWPRSSSSWRVSSTSTSSRNTRITYRSTAEALRHERYLYLANAGPYLAEDRHSQLAERIEGLISQEHAK